MNTIERVETTIKFGRSQYHIVLSPTDSLKRGWDWWLNGKHYHTTPSHLRGNTQFMHAVERQLAEQGF